MRKQNVKISEQCELFFSKQKKKKEKEKEEENQSLQRRRKNSDDNSKVSIKQSKQRNFVIHIFTVSSVRAVLLVII